MDKKLKDKIDLMRDGRKDRRITLTKEQEEFIIFCRDHKNPLSQRKMAIMWEQDMKWGKISKYAIETRIEKLKAEGKLK